MCWFKANEADERDRHRKPQQPYRTQLQLLRTGFERKKAQVLLVQLLRLLRLMASLLLLLRMRLAAFVTRLIFRTLTKKLFCIDLGSSTIVAVEAASIPNTPMGMEASKVKITNSLRLITITPTQWSSVRA